MRKKTHKEFLEQVKNKTGEEYQVLSEYTGSHDPVTFKCTKCNHVFTTKATTFLKTKSGCIKCGYEKMKAAQRKTDHQFKEEVRGLVGEEYVFIDKYVNNTTKLAIHHIECDNFYKVTPRDFLSGRRCPFCKSKRITEAQMLSTEDFSEKLNNRYNGEFAIVNDYRNAKTLVDIKHEVCGSIFKTKPSKFLYQSRCPKCSTIGNSFGEEQIRNYFDKNGISYTAQYYFSDCKDIRPLPFDFAVYQDNKMVFLIEYQGLQHYKPIEFFGGEDVYLDRKRKDKIKKDYCESKGIKLIEIPYYERDITSLLDEIIKLHMPIPSRA